MPLNANTRGWSSSARTATSSPSWFGGPGSSSVAEQVAGVGGVFFRARDPDALRAWYAQHLGIEMEDYGTTFTGGDGDQTVWAPFPAGTEYFGSRGPELMGDFRV